MLPRELNSQPPLISLDLDQSVRNSRSLIYAPLAQMVPFSVILLILLVRPTGLYGNSLVKR